MIYLLILICKLVNLSLPVARTQSSLCYNQLIFIGVQLWPLMNSNSTLKLNFPVNAAKTGANQYPDITKPDLLQELITNYDQIRYKPFNTVLFFKFNLAYVQPQLSFAIHSNAAFNPILP